MSFIETFSEFELNNNKINIFYHKEGRCFKINDYYVFLDDRKVIKENELANEGFSDYLPKTTSGWIHLGVDVVSTIVSFVGPLGYGISIVIDILHAIAYFVESQYDKENEENLIIGGIITAAFALLPAAVGGVVKGILKTTRGSGTSIFSVIMKTNKIPNSTKKSLIKHWKITKK